MKTTLFFSEPKEFFSGRDSREFKFPFRIVDTELVGAPEEHSKSENAFVNVSVSCTLETTWDLSDNNLIKVMFEYGKRHVIQKLKDRTFLPKEQLFLSTRNTEHPCQFDPERIEEPVNAIVKIEFYNKPIMQEKTLLQLASAIIDARDNINALFHQKNGEKLLFLGEERDLLQFFRSADTQEEFVFRICALANVATKFNVDCLRKLTGDTNKDHKSITLLEQYLAEEHTIDSTTIDHLRNINILRQGYLVHGDRNKRVLGAHKYFGLDYPIMEFDSAWRTLLSMYLYALNSLLNKLINKEPKIAETVVIRDPDKLYQNGVAIADVTGTVQIDGTVLFTQLANVVGLDRSQPIEYRRRKLLVTHVQSTFGMKSVVSDKGSSVLQNVMEGVTCEELK